VGLLNIKLSDNTLLLRGRSVTGFSNIEKLAELDKEVPFLTENELGTGWRVPEGGRPVGALRG
jgi:hypothetical protein